MFLFLHFVSYRLGWALAEREVDRVLPRSRQPLINANIVQFVSVLTQGETA